MKVTDTSAHVLSAYDGGSFSLALWEAYMDRWVPGARELCLDDMRDCLKAGYSWEGDYLPVLNAVAADPAGREKAARSFREVTDGLDERIRSRFGKSVDADVVLYLGLCSGAGWVTEVRGRTAVLLGIEKILELGWCGRDDMTGLIVHELGHVYHARYGTYPVRPEDLRDRMLLQLFTEGVAMVFEQEVVGDPGYFHQDRDGWKAWCDENADRLREAFDRDLGVMTPRDQRYFGDWVRWEGHGDTGYYLGARFVRFLLRSAPFDEVIRFGTDEVRRGYADFLRSAL